MKAAIRSVRGMTDLLPEDTAVAQHIEARARACFALYGYGELRTPLVEKTELFRRQLGEHTDLVEKEMYTFATGEGGESLSLRPEATVPSLRALQQRGMLSGSLHKSRVYYMGPMFRHERPQQGRYRQFHQLGAEAVGFAGPGIDAEQVAMCRRLWEGLGIGGSVALEVNNLGNAAERRAHRESLVEYFRAHEADLDADSRRRLDANPLRIFDSKHERTQEIARDAPKLGAHMGGESRRFFDEFLAALDRLGIPSRLNHSLVRGLDYYSNAVYEWVYAAEGRDLTLCGGGRYDGLAEQIGAAPTPGCGFAIGAERLAGLVGAAQAGAARCAPRCDAFVTFDAALAHDAAALAEELRGANVRTCADPDGGSFKAQMRKADASGARYALVLGSDEAGKGEVSVKPLREGGSQFRIGRKRVANKLKELLGK